MTFKKATYLLVKFAQTNKNLQATSLNSVVPNLLRGLRESIEFIKLEPETSELFSLTMHQRLIYITQNKPQQ